jgi:hypothetical protein
MTRSDYRISEQEWEELNAYLDGEIKGLELERFQAKLVARIDLRAALSELQQNHSLLARYARVRSRRNFTLTPEIVGITLDKTARYSIFGNLYPIFSLSSVVASLLFGFLFLANADLFRKAAVMDQTVEKSVPMAPAAQESAPRELEVEKLQEEQSQAELPVEKTGADAAMVPDEPYMEEYPYAGIGLGGGGQAPPGEEAPLFAPAPVEETEMNTPQLRMTDEPTQETIQPQQATATSYPAPVEEITGSSQIERGAFLLKHDYLVILQSLLVALAVIFGGLALVARRYRQ